MSPGISEPSLELLIRTNTRLTLASYTQILTEIRLALGEVDRVAVPGRTPRIDWAIRETSGAENIRVLLAPERIPVRRTPDSMSAASVGLAAGIRELQDAPAIPPLFSARTVERVRHVGTHVERGAVAEIQVISTNGTRTDSSVDPLAVEHARRAVEPSRRVWSSVIGRLEVLISRGSRDPRAIIIEDGTRSAVMVRAATDQKDLLRQAWERRVVASGELTRNGVGQAIRLDLDSLEVLPERTRISAWDLLGNERDATGSMTTAEYMDILRRG